MSPTERRKKEFDYFILTREQPLEQAVTGQYLFKVNTGVDRNLIPSVNFQFNTEGANRFFALTSANLPTGPADNQFDQLYRFLAIIMDGQIMTAPRLAGAIREHGKITGSFTKSQVDRMAAILRAGALPAALKPLPVSEISVEKK